MKWLVAIFTVVAVSCSPSQNSDVLCSSSADCDDSNPCTADICTADGCDYRPNLGSCDDGDPCTQNDRCSDGVCAGTGSCDCGDWDQDGFTDHACGGLDCNDQVPEIHPGANDICDDGVDQDCDGEDESCECVDWDEDGFQDEACGGLDCDDHVPEVHPGAKEICDDGVDQDCNGIDQSCSCVDLDEDGYQDHACGGLDCDDNAPLVNPGAQEICGDGIDQDCDGEDPQCPCPDEDRDGFIAAYCGGDDCDDLRDNVNPGLVEGENGFGCLDGLDNDCDGLYDSQEAGCDAANDSYSNMADLSGSALRNALHNRIDGHTALGYDSAKDFMFSELDNKQGRVQCVYTGEWVDTWGIPNNNVMNTEHTWCQSWGADREPARSDLHHLFPSLSTVNSRRGSLPFNEVSQVTWSRGGSFAGLDSAGRSVFEPRDEHKGDAARALFYFAVRYEMNINNWMEETLRKWNAQDPPDQKEIQRCDGIESRQHNRNPFVDRPGFVDRIHDF